MNTLHSRRRPLYGRATIATLFLLCGAALGFLGGVSLSGCATAAHATPAITHSAADLLHGVNIVPMAVQSNLPILAHTNQDAQWCKFGGLYYYCFSRWESRTVGGGSVFFEPVLCSSSTFAGSYTEIGHGPTGGKREGGELWVMGGTLYPASSLEGSDNPFIAYNLADMSVKGALNIGFVDGVQGALAPHTSVVAIPTGAPVSGVFPVGTQYLLFTFGTNGALNGTTGAQSLANFIVYESATQWTSNEHTWIDPLAPVSSGGGGSTTFGF